MNRQAEFFFDSYSLAEEAAYDNYFKINEGNYNIDNHKNDNTIEAYLQNEIGKWLSTPSEMLEDMTPVEFLNTVRGLEQLTEMFTYGAVKCDNALPEIFLNKYRDYGEDAINTLLGIITHWQAECSEEMMLVAVMAVKLMGKWKVSSAAEPLIQVLGTGSDTCELMFETVTDALICIGMPALDSILSSLDQGLHSQTAIEYLIMALSAIGRENPSDRIYKSLRNVFTQLSNKIAAVSSLADYGDGKAIPVLRGYLEKHIHQIDAQTFHEIVSAIRCLGGKTDDLVYKK